MNRDEHTPDVVNLADDIPTLALILTNTGNPIDALTITGWTVQQRKDAVNWAVANWMTLGGTQGLIVPPKPEHMP